jgi:AAA+ ATPase superfamily predicted ATPase
VEIKLMNRENELRHLEDIYGQKGTKVVIFYERRRVGKPEITKAFLRKERLSLLAGR